MRKRIIFFVLLSIYIIVFSYAEPGLFSWFITDEGLWANDARWMVLWHSLPEDGFAQSLFAAPLFYLMEYYLFLLFGVSLKVFHIFLSLWAVATLFVIMFLLKYDKWWGIVWTVILSLIVNLGLIDIISMFLLILSFYLSFRKRMYLLSSFLLSLSVLAKWTVLPYSGVFFVFILFLSFKEKEYKEIGLMMFFFFIPMILHLLFIKECWYYFEGIRHFLLYRIKFAFWGIVYKSIFNNFVANPIIFLIFPPALFYIFNSIRSLDKEDIFMLIFIFVGVFFILFTMHIVPRRMFMLFFPLFILSEKGIKKMGRKWTEMLYFSPSLILIVGSANILRKGKYWFSFVLPKEWFYSLYVVFVVVFMLIIWKKRWYRQGIVFVSILIIMWNLCHISYERIQIVNELKKLNLKGYIFFFESDLYVEHTFTMESGLKPMKIWKNSKNKRWVVENNEIIWGKYTIPCHYMGILFIIPNIKIHSWQRIYIKDIGNMTKGSHYFLIYRRGDAR